MGNNQLTADWEQKHVSIYSLRPPFLKEPSRRRSSVTMSTEASDDS